MSELTLEADFLDKLQDYPNLYVGYSGGLDSTVLLHLLVTQLPDAGSVHAIHINHGLSPNAARWQLHAEAFCQQLNITCTSHELQLLPGGNLEERARDARYDIFKSILNQQDALLLAHHQDDQAETFLLNLMRGAGVDGLSGMKSVQSLSNYHLIRPLLAFSRAQIQAYAVSHGLRWIEDESNDNERLARNFIRRQVLPLLSSYWPAATDNIVRAASHCQQAKQNLQTLAEMDAGRLTPTLSLTTLKQLSKPRLINVLRYWIHLQGHQLPSEKTLLRVIDEVILARPDAQPLVTFGESIIRRFQDKLYCDVNMPQREKNESLVWPDFPSSFLLPGHLGTLIARPGDKGILIPPSSAVEVRFREGGETFSWRGQTKCLKKCLQQWHVPPWQREKVPLIFVNGKLAAVVGFAISDECYTTQQGFTIQLTAT